MPLHTPDQLASASLVTAYVRGYQLTGNPDYLRSARKWALSGVPFVYLWGSPSDHGLQHAARVRLHPLEKHLLVGPPRAVGRRRLCLCTHPTGPVRRFAGLESTGSWHPDYGRTDAVSRRAECRPAAGRVRYRATAACAGQHQSLALVSLRLVLDGQLDSLAVATDGKHRIVAPFPVTLKDGKAEIQGKPGLRYQILLDGERVTDVESQGLDRLATAEK